MKWNSLRSARLGALLFSTAFFAASAQATTYDVYAYDENHHGVWMPGIDQRHLLFDSGSTLSVESDVWNLEAALTSATDGTRWHLTVQFTGILTGPEFGATTGYDDGRIKGATWADIHSDWAFAGRVEGTLTGLDGIWAGHIFELTRHAGNHDYYAQFGTCLNDKNCDKGLSTWLTAQHIKTGEIHRGDINARVAAPVPEPSAALVFGLGSLIAGSAIRRGE